MKARSPKLAEYLEKVGALDSTDPNAIKNAKAAYRREYKAAHKREHGKKQHELRPQFSDAEYGRIQAKAQHMGLTPTAYIKAVALAADGIVPRKDVLHHILQTVSMVAIRLEKEHHPSAESLSQAEAELIRYLTK